MENSIPTPGPRRVECPGCKKYIGIRQNGTLWHHRSQMPEWPGSPFKKVCPYSGLTPEAGAE